MADRPLETGHDKPANPLTALFSFFAGLPEKFSRLLPAKRGWRKFFTIGGLATLAMLGIGAHAMIGIYLYHPYGGSVAGVNDQAARQQPTSSYPSTSPALYYPFQVAPGTEPQPDEPQKNETKAPREVPSTPAQAASEGHRSDQNISSRPDSQPTQSNSSSSLNTRTDLVVPPTPQVTPMPEQNNLNVLAVCKDGTKILKTDAKQNCGGHGGLDYWVNK